MEEPLPFAVNGTLMRGLERNGDLVGAGGTFHRETWTAPSYRLWSIDDVHPAMLHDASGGRPIAVEIWLVPPAAIAAILLGEPPGLCVGRLTLDDGSVVLGVLCEPSLVDGRQEITAHGGWRAYVAAKPQLGPRFDRAFELARDLHSDQRRKGSEIPYVSHLMAVASLVLEDGGDEDEAIAALLHDAVEDQGGQQTLRRIRAQFGARVADIVAACSDTDVVPKPPWRERKEAYIAHLRDPHLPAGALRVSLADKLHNSRAILFDLHAGHDVYARFNAGRDDQHWYYGELATTFEEVSSSPMAIELRRVVDQLLTHA